MEQSTAPSTNETSDEASASLPLHSADSRGKTPSTDVRESPSLSSAIDKPPATSQAPPAPQQQSSSLVPQSQILSPGTYVQLTPQPQRLAFEDNHGQCSSYQSLSLPSRTGTVITAAEHHTPPHYQQLLIPPEALQPPLSAMAASLTQPLHPALIPGALTAAPALTSTSLQLEPGLLIFPLGHPASVVGSGVSGFSPSTAPITLGVNAPFGPPLPTLFDLIPFMPPPDPMVQPPLPIIATPNAPGPIMLAQQHLTLEQTEAQTGLMDMDISTTPLDTPKDAPSTPQHAPMGTSATSQRPRNDDLTTSLRALRQVSSAEKPELVEQMEEQTDIMDMDISTTPLDTPKDKPSTPQHALKEASATPERPREGDFTTSPKQDPSALPYSPTDEPTTSPYSPTKEPMQSPLYSPTYDPLSPSSVDFSYSPPSSPPDFAALEASEMSAQQTSTVQEEPSTYGSILPSPRKGASSKSHSTSKLSEASASAVPSSGAKSTRHSMGEKQPHSTAEPPSSALAVQDIQKKALILRAEQEVKFAIRKYVSSREISTEEYKHILKHAIKKICSSKRTGINPRIIGQFIERYVESMKRRRGKPSTKHQD